MKTTAEMIASMPPGMLDEIVSAHVLGIKGHVSVELVDDRTGRVVATEEGDNYVNSAMWQEWAKYAQKAAWTVGYQGDASTVTARTLDSRDPRLAPSLRNDVIAAWTDTTAEDTADLYPFGEVVAWAHRWQQGSPSTRQGIVQPTLCTLTGTAVSWVWEWATSNGNGTFQSVGWRRLNSSSNSGEAILSDARWQQPRYISGISNTSIVGGQNHTGNYTPTSGPSSANISIGLGQYCDGTNLWFVGIFGTVTKLYSSPITFDSIGNFTLGAVVDQSAAAYASGLKVNGLAFGSSAVCNGITRLGTSGDWIGVGQTGVNFPSRRPYIARVTNAGVTTYTNANAGTYANESSFQDVTYDGTNLWVLAERGATGAAAMHRIDPATGTLNTTVSAVVGVPAYFPQWGSSNWPIGIEWEAATSTFWIQDTNGLVYGIDGSGNWNGVLLGGTIQTMPITAATLSGQHNARRANSRGQLDIDPSTVVLDNTDVASSVYPWNDAVQGFASEGNNGFKGRMLTMGSFIVSGGTGISNGGANWLHTGLNRKVLFASRSLLASSVTKNNTQTMRIRYTLTFT